MTTFGTSSYSRASLISFQRKFNRLNLVGVGGASKLLSESTSVFAQDVSSTFSISVMMVFVCF